MESVLCILPVTEDFCGRHFFVRNFLKRLKAICYTITDRSRIIRVASNKKIKGKHREEKGIKSCIRHDGKQWNYWQMPQAVILVPGKITAV